MSTALQTQLDAIKARIESLAPSATAEDVVMLAKAVESVAGQMTVFDLMDAGDAELADIAAAGPVQTDLIAAAGVDALTAIDAARDQATTHVQAQGITRADLHAAHLSF